MKVYNENYCNKRKSSWYLGYTHFLIEKLFEGAKKEGAECEEITLAKLKINICTGCGVCHTEKHLLKCIYEEKDDDVAMIFEKMREAEIIIS